MIHQPIHQHVLLCGEIHYFRTPRVLWEDRVLKAKRAGLNCISSYIPWNWHEPLRDIYVFDDYSHREWYVASSFSRNIEGYLKTIRELGMYFIARPGPYICSEWDSGGHPNWLYNETARLRSLDDKYMYYAEKWYSKILPILKEYTISKGGPVVLLQVENEYFWGFKDYILRLHDVAKRYIDVDDISIVTNENPFLENTLVANTIDDYPAPWSIERFDRKLESYMKSQPGLFKMFMELEGGWFSTINGYLPTSRGSFPASWTEILVKTAIGMGLNAINIYMFHGGTNPGYYTGKYITTTYDYEASIREWGELSERYYAVKRVFTFANTFKDLLSRTKPVQTAVKQVYDCTKLFARINDDGEMIIVLRNLGDNICNQRLLINDDFVPLHSDIRVPLKYAKIMVMNHKLRGTPFKLIYSTAEPLLKQIHGDSSFLVFYGDIGEKTETLVEAEDALNIKCVHGFVKYSLSGNRVIVENVHGDLDNMVALESRGKTLYMVFTNRDRAGRTWLIDELNPPMILISNLYFIGKTSYKNNALLLELELDEKSHGDILILTPRPIKKMFMNNRELYFEKPCDNAYFTRLDREDVKIVEKPVIHIDNRVYMREDPITHRDIMKAIQPCQPLEKAGFFENGYYFYTVIINIDEESYEKLVNKRAFISGINDYASLIVNGKHVSSGYHVLEVDLTDYLKPGINEFQLILESTGHPNDGVLYVPNGILNPFYLGEINTIPLRNWIYIDTRPQIGPYFDMSMFIERPESILQVLGKIKDIVNDESVAIDRAGLFVKRIHMEKLNGRYVLDLGTHVHSNFYPRILVFVNGEYLGPYIKPMDITDHMKKGINEIAVFSERGGLFPVLRNYQYALSGDWFVQKGIYGLNKEWFKQGVDENWIKTTIPLRLFDKAGGVVWVKIPVEINTAKITTSPLKLRLKGQGFRALLFFNGEFIGRYSVENPQREFYIFDDLIKRGINEVTIMMHIVSHDASLVEVSIEPYYVHRSSELVIE
ncbi:MAG: beta-galactosidase [Desulfurococcaceae archaeon]